MHRSSVVLGAAVLGMALGVAASSRAAEEPVWSLSYAGVSGSNYCGGPGVPCPQNLTKLGQDLEMRFGDSSASMSASSYGGLTGGANLGTAFASAGVGDGVGPQQLVLPELKAFAEATLLPAPVPGPGGTPLGFGWNYAYAQAVTALKWTEDVPAVIPLNTFIAEYDYASTGPAQNGYVLAGFALTTNAIIGNNAIGGMWHDYGLAADGSRLNAFSATCGTPGALAIANSSRILPAATGSVSLGITTSCVGSQLVLNPGDELYFWAKLDVFRASAGTTDASHTLNVTFNPIYQGTQFEQDLFAGFTQIETANISVAVPEPSTWAMLIAGFGAIGAMMRRRREALA